MIRKLIRYLVPITRIVHSDYSGKLELTTWLGKTVLNTANANYSYGSLQKVLRFALTRVDLSKASHILVLGLGGGSVLKTIRAEFNFTGSITAVDIDPVIVKIAGNEFGILSNDQTRIHCEDALLFLRRRINRYELIIIDLFIDNRIPDKFLSEDFWIEVLENLEKDGTIIFNMLSDPSSDVKHIERLLSENGFQLQLFRKVEKSNNVLIATKVNLR
jgi:spermidine synthase